MPSQVIKNYTAAVAAVNHVDNPAHQFAVDPAPSQKMRGAVQKSSAFLQKVNFVAQDNIAGRTVGLSVGLIASRTGTHPTDKRRNPKPVHSAAERKYYCQKVNFDYAWPYSDLDRWAHEPDYVGIINQQLVTAKALSLLAMGFNGKQFAADSDMTANPLLQDVARGWLENIRAENAPRVLGWEGGAVGTTKKAVKYGKAQEYKNIDAIVFDAIKELIADEFAGRDDFVVIAAARTLGDKYFTLINAAAETPTETVAGDILASTRRIGGLPGIAVPYFPKDTLLITPASNLSIYFHKTGHRRKLADEPEYDRLANYESENIDYVVEEYGACALIENIEHVA